MLFMEGEDHEEEGTDEAEDGDGDRDQGQGLQPLGWRPSNRKQITN